MVGQTRRGRKLLPLWLRAGRRLADLLFASSTRRETQHERTPDVPRNRMCLRCDRAGHPRGVGDAVTPPFLRRSRNESYRLRGLPLAVTLSGLALLIVVVLVGLAAIIVHVAPAYLGLMLLALMIVLAALMVYRGMR